VIHELSPLDAPKWCSGFSENPMFMHLLEHPFVFRHQNQRIIQARRFRIPARGAPDAFSPSRQSAQWITSVVTVLTVVLQTHLT
jgi:hypothetical protein